MIKIYYSKNFLKSSKKLPIIQQRKLAKLLTQLQKNPYNPLLHTKQLSGKLLGLFSFSITRNWRVIFQFTNTTTIQLLRTAHRKEIYK